MKPGKADVSFEINVKIITARGEINTMVLWQMATMAKHLT